MWVAAASSCGSIVPLVTTSRLAWLEVGGSLQLFMIHVEHGPPEALQALPYLQVRMDVWSDGEAAVVNGCRRGCAGQVGRLVDLIMIGQYMLASSTITHV